MKKSSLMFILILCVLLILTGCTSAYNKPADTPSQPAGEEKVEIQKDAVKIKIANNVADDHPQSVVLANFGKLLEEKSNGRFDVEIYNNNLLGTAEVYTDSMIKGTVEMGLPGTILAQYYPLDATMSCPFLIRDWDHFMKVIENGILNDAYSNMPEKVGLRYLGEIPSGFRVVASTKPVKKFEDFKGLRLRMPNIPVYLEVGKALGTNTISMALNEVYTGLEQGAVDACENTYATLYTSKYHEVAPYIIETNHIFNTLGFIVNEKFWQGLSEEDRTLINECVQTAIEKGWADIQALEKQFKENMKAEGGEIFTPDEAFREKIVNSQEKAKQVFWESYPGTKEFNEKIMNLK